MRGPLRVVGWILKTALRAAWLGAMVAVPLFGFWLASSVAAYQNASTWGALAIGLALFPVVPVGWDLVHVWRRGRREGEPSRSILTRLDRLVLRTLLVNGLFLGIMLGRMPHVAFRALAVRGDWMLDGAHGELADRVRGGLLGLADRFEKRWHVVDDAYGDSDAAPDAPPPTPDAPPPMPIPTPTPDAPDAPAVADAYPGWPVAAEPEVQVTAMPAEAQASIASVGTYLAERIPDPRRRIKAIHDFVVLRLAYDHDAATLIDHKAYADVPKQDAEAVFARRTAVCEGYARLMVALGKASGVEIAFVTGYARDTQYHVSDAALTDDAVRASLGGYLHAWNAARIDGVWTLIDATWDDSDEAGAPVSSDYLFTPPALFATQHLPDLPPWQLLAAPLTAGQFVRQPLLRPAAGKLRITLAEPTRSQVTVDGALDVVIDNPRHAQVVAAYLPAATHAPADRHDCGDGRPVSGAHVTLHCELPAGTYEVELFGAASKASSNLAYLGSIAVNRR